MPENLVASIHRLTLILADRFPFAAPRNRGFVQLYLFTIALMGFALFLRLSIWPVSAGLQYVTFFPAVTLAAIVGGYRAGLLATMIGVALATYIFTPPYFSLSIDVLQASLWSNVVFLIDGVIVSFSIEAMHHFRQHYQRELKETRESEAHMNSLNEELERQVAERKQAEAALMRHARDLGERIKEIECLRDITDLLLNKEMNMDQVLDACARRIPAALFDPSHSCARIRRGEQTYESSNFRETGSKLAAAICTAGRKSGVVEIFYFGEGAMDRSPFLDDEHSLIQSISIQISQSLEKRSTEAALEQSQTELKEAQRIARVGSWRMDVATNHVVWSDELYRILGWSPESRPDFTERRKIFAPESRERLAAAMSRTLERGVSP